MKNYICLICLFIFVLGSCDSESYIKTYRLPKKSNDNPVQIKQNKEPTKINEKSRDFTLKWEKPDGWEQFEGHSMRMASFYVPHSTGKGELSITEFSGMSGGIQANINRWRGQISLPPESIESILKASSSFNSNLGDFLFFELVNEKSNQGILASIFELTNRTVFVKLSIDQLALAEAKEDFLTFSKSFSK